MCTIKSVNIAAKKMNWASFKDHSRTHTVHSHSHTGQQKHMGMIHVTLLQKMELVNE